MVTVVPLRLVRGVVLPLAAAVGCASPRRLPAPVQAPALLRGDFTDDYRGRFSISDTVWFQQPRNRFRIVEWHAQEQYLIAQNGADDPTAPGRWSRIDWMVLEGMAPYTWGFCLTAYQAPSQAAARATPPATRATPRTGCNGFPFTRMQRVAAPDA
jgi:hypothetical protein